MKTLLLLLIVLAGAGYGAYGALEKQKAEIATAERELATKTAERDALAKENAAFAPNVDKAKAELAAVPNSPLPAPDAAALKEVEDKIAESQSKLKALIAANEAALKQAQEDALAAVTEVKETGDNGLAAVKEKIAALKTESSKLDSLQRLMKPVITAEEVASKGKEQYKSTARATY